MVETLEGMEKSRRAFRLIGGVLVERTVEEVLPSVKQNQSGITQVKKTVFQFAMHMMYKNCKIHF